jgi:hypothetical protein
MIQTDNQTNILVFRTNINSSDDIQKLSPVLKTKEILKWNVDFDDPDRILRIVTKGSVPGEIIKFARAHGIDCSELE